MSIAKTAILKLPRGSVVASETVKEAIIFNETKRERYNTLENYYEGEHSILKRTKPETLANNKAVINHAEYITDTFVGYLLANPVEHKLIGKDDEASKKSLEAVLTEYKKQTIRKADSELATNCSIFGIAYEYIYVNERGDVKSKCIDPRNCIVVRDDSMEENILFAVIYSAVTDSNGDPVYSDYLRTKTLKNINFKDVTAYDSNFVYTFDEKLNVINKLPHYFGFVPVIEYKNKRKYRGDFEKVITLIDAYNLLQSDRLNDKEQFVNALLMFYGFKVTDELMASARTFKTIAVPPRTEGTDAAYLVKQLEEADLDILRDRIEQDIHKISKTPNMSDRQFAGNASGVAISYKLLPFEWATVKKEEHFEDALKERFIRYNHYLSVKDPALPVLSKSDIDVVFHRGLPRNDFETSQIINNLADFVDIETLLGQLSFISDAKVTIARKKKEKEEALKLFGLEEYGRDEPIGGSNKNDEDEIEET